MLNPLKYVNDRLNKCRVAYNVYKDKDEVDKEKEEVNKEYALFKIIDLIKNSQDLDKQVEVMDKLKKITNNCNSIIEKRFGLFNYLFNKKVHDEKYYTELNIKNFQANTFVNFFNNNKLLLDDYIKDNDDEAIIFKLKGDEKLEGDEKLKGDESKKPTRSMYIRLSKKNLAENSQLNEQLKINSAENSQLNEQLKIKIFRINTFLRIKDSKFFNYSLIEKTAPFEIKTEGMGNMNGDIVASKIYNINNISINNKKLAVAFNKTLLNGGIGKKTIKTKSKPLKNTTLQKKEILGKDMRIYKINGSKKEYVKYKGTLIAVSDYKKIIKLKKK